jgi:hypothetical protein
MNDLAEDSATAERRRIAHDLSNQIMVVQGNLDLLRMKLDREERPWSHLELASDASSGGGSHGTLRACRETY